MHVWEEVSPQEWGLWVTQGVCAFSARPGIVKLSSKLVAPFSLPTVFLATREGENCLGSIVSSTLSNVRLSYICQPGIC